MVLPHDIQCDFPTSLATFTMPCAVSNSKMCDAPILVSPECNCKRGTDLCFKSGQVDIAKVWATITTVLLAFVFVFGNSIRNIYEAVIFLFVVHPFDVGDVLLMGPDQTTWHQVGRFLDAQMAMDTKALLYCSLLLANRAAISMHNSHRVF